MARFRSRMAMRPIQRIKHVVDSSQTLAAGTQLNLTVINATDTPTLGASASVITGSKVYGVYVKVEVASNEAHDAGAIPNVYFGLFKSVGNGINPPALNAVGISDDKRFMLHQEMIVIENKGAGGNSRILFNGVIKIPKGHNRMGPNDVMYLCVLSPALDIVECHQVHFKEFR